VQGRQDHVKKNRPEKDGKEGDKEPAYRDKEENKYHPKHITLYLRLGPGRFT
jgi:hypothetical protein